jgi:hypothetical protein
MLNSRYPQVVNGETYRLHKQGNATMDRVSPLKIIAFL